MNDKAQNTIISHTDETRTAKQPFAIAVRKRIRSILGRVLGQNLSFEHTVFLCGAFAGMSLAAFGAIGNYTMGFHWLSVIVPAGNFLVDIACIAYSIITKRWRGAAIVLFFCASYILFPFLWFTTGGTMSSSLPLVIGLGVVLAIVFSGKWRGFFFFFTLLVYSTMIIVELHNPNNFIPYPSRETQYWDVLFGFVLSFLVSGGLAYFTLTRYNSATRKTERLVQQLEKISITDPLTDVYNRRHLMVRLDEEMRKAYDNGAPLTLCLLDIDFFKHVNDTHGHLYGDEVLVKLAETITSCLHNGEIFGRYGGEEFIIVSQNSKLPATLETLVRVQEALRQVEWPHGEPITISGGVSVYTKGISYSKFLENADANLYKAKHNGRNRMEY